MYSYLVIGTSAEETVQEEEVYKIFSGMVRVRVRIYRADNGRFPDKPFRLAVEERFQLFTYCGVVPLNQHDIS